MPKIAIIAALERELWPLIKSWPKSQFTHEGHDFAAYESAYAVAVCGGIGPEYGRRTAEAAISRYSPKILISAGLAGAAVPELRVGETVFPAIVVDTGDGSRHETAINDSVLRNTSVGRTVLASSAQISSSAQKRQLAKSYGAHVIDMEGAAVARAAQVHNLAFIAIKAVSDDLNFEIAWLNRFVRSGSMATVKLVIHVVPRPWLWPKMLRLAQNTRLASDNLCAWLRESALTNTITSSTQAGAGEDARPSKA